MGSHVSAQQSSPWRRLLRGGSWGLLGTAGNRAATLLVGVIVARLCGQTDYGEFGAVYNTIAMFLVYSQLGTGTVGNRYVARYRDDDPERAGAIMGATVAVACVLGLVAAGLAVALAPLIARHALDAPHLTTTVRIGAIVIGVGTLRGAISGCLNGLEALREAALAICAAALIGIPIVATTAAAYGVTGAIAGLAITTSLETCFRIMVLRRVVAAKGLRITFGGIRRELSLFKEFGLPAVLYWSMPVPVSWVSYAILARSPLGGYHELAVYHAARQWQALILYVPTSLGGLLISLLSNTLKAKHENRQLFKYSLFACVATASVASAFVCALAPLILRLYGPGFEAGYSVMLVSALAAIPMSVTAVLGYSATSKNMVRPLLAVGLVANSVLLGLFVGVVDSNALGLAVATVAGAVVQLALLVLAHWHARRASSRASVLPHSKPQ